MKHLCSLLWLLDGQPTKGNFFSLTTGHRWSWQSKRLLEMNRKKLKVNLGWPVHLYKIRSSPYSTLDQVPRTTCTWLFKTSNLRELLFTKVVRTYYSSKVYSGIETKKVKSRHLLLPSQFQSNPFSFQVNSLAALTTPQYEPCILNP